MPINYLFKCCPLCVYRRTNICKECKTVGRSTNYKRDSRNKAERKLNDEVGFYRDKVPIKSGEFTPCVSTGRKVFKINGTALTDALRGAVSSVSGSNCARIVRKY